MSTVLQIYGGAAQDFGSARTNWESYGWSLFKLMDPPAGTYKDHVKIQVCLGPVCVCFGLHSPSSTCSQQPDVQAADSLVLSVLHNAAANRVSSST